MNSMLFILLLVPAASAILPEPIDQCVTETTITKLKDAICNDTLKSGGEITDYKTGWATKEDISKINTKLTAMHELLQSCGKDTCNTFIPKDCQDLLLRGYRESKVYTIYPNNGTWFQVYCDQETDGGGWTVIQRRQDGSEDFFRTWNDYKTGFGNLSNEFWLGNDKIHTITNSGNYTIRFDLKDFLGNSRHASYSTFNVGNEESGYFLKVSGYSGDAGNAFTIGSKFVTKDRDDRMSCAKTSKGAWWYKFCHLSNLNGLYLKDKDRESGDVINWIHWKGFRFSLMFTEMKLRKQMTFK